MSLPVIVDIVIGLAFIYLLLSLLASEIQELIATLLQWRAKHLKDSITNLFASDIHSNHSVEKAQQLAKQVYQHPLIRGVNQESKGFLTNLFRGITWLSSLIYRRIVGKSEGEFGDRRTAPSYIPREAFSTALLEQLGTKYFVERLVEAKFSEFVESILEKVGADKTIKPQAGYQKLEKNLHKIEQEFIGNRVDLNSAVQSIISKLNTCLQEMEGKVENDDLEELKDWQERVFENKKLEQVIKNAGLNPSLQEIVDSIDKNSKTYRTYKDRFRRYEQERFRDVRQDLRDFEEFLLVFLRGVLMVEGTKTPQNTSPMPESMMQASKDLLTELEKLDGLFFEDGVQDGEIQRTKMPMAQIEHVIIEHLLELEKKLKQEAKNRKTKRLLYSIHAFREGFEGKNHLSYWRDFRFFRASISNQVVPFGLMFGIGLLIAIGLSNIGLPDASSDVQWWEQWAIGFRNLLIGRWGGLFSIACLVGIPFLWFTISRLIFDWLKRRHRAKHSCQRLSILQQAASSCKTLTEIFDDYSADEVPPVLKTPTTDQRPVSQERSNQDFVRAIATRMDRIASEPEAVLYSEVKDLGRSFRSYYLRFSLEHADVDLPFIPTSIKQSLAVLIRRSKNSAKQAEDQIIHLKSEVEAWYDRSMERASGVYRRNAKGIAILIGFGLAIAVNANSIHILDQLAFDNELRQTMVDAIRFAPELTTQEAEISDTEELLASLQDSLDGINLPIGWDPHLIDEEFKCDLHQWSPPSNAGAIEGEDEPGVWHQLIQACIYNQDEKVETTNGAPAPEAFFYPTAVASIFLRQPLIGLRYLLGWMITGIAISMGASFWFDLLSKLVKVRNTGNPLPTLSEGGAKKDATEEKGRN